MTGPARDELAARLGTLLLRDERRLRRRLQDRRLDLARFEREVASAEERVARRRALVPAVSYPEQLPVSAAKDEIAAALQSSQVVVLAGETGSGKTTQLPKICLELGRGVRGQIGHTQPRRIAARSVAERVAEELDVPLGDAVGFKVRFNDTSSDDTLVKLMTDGVLLAEAQRDPDLLRYDTVIVDEAHERSLNIDFLLGYLTQLLPRRPDLKLVITSATIETERFSQHFGGCPVVEVSGRTYPVEVRYRPPEEEVDQVSAICAAVDELSAEGPGDVLVFLSGEREIRDTADGLRETVPAGTEVLPLYARLSAAEQHRVFAPHPGRRVVLATNVAETSLTVPGVRYVVDPGLARISRYSARTKVQRLPIERISQASARQRAGRCGRVAEGVCIRLYSEEDHDSRPEHTEPELLRTNLASVILQMTALGLGDVEAFPFVEPPDRRNVKDGVELLRELGALVDGRLTPLGRQLAQLPVDPRLGRMVLEGQSLGCLREVLVIASALSIQDPRERPSDKQQAAAEMHRRFTTGGSDFLAYLELWDHLRDKQAELSGNQFRRLCRAEFLNHLRVREWQDLHGQLRSVVKGLGMTPAGGAVAPDQVHRALLSGLLSHLGLREGDTREYVGARGARFALAPGSVLAKKPPRWVMAAELVETNRLWGRVAASISPEWAEQLAPHLVQRTYSEPRWERSRAAAVADERVTLYGVPLVAKRRVDYARVDAAHSRELFLRHALVEGEWDTHHAFLAENRALLEQVEDLEHRARRRGIVVDEEALLELYDARVPAEVVSGRHFDSWWKKARHETPRLLSFTLADLVDEEVAAEALDAPDVWVEADLHLPLSYQFAPGSEADGVTVHVPLSVLNRVGPDAFAWQVPALREELVTALLRSLPKPLRRAVGPAPDAARAVLEQVAAREEPLLDALERALWQVRGVRVARTDWDLARVPDHLRPTFLVEDEDGTVLAEGKDLRALQASLAAPVQAALSSAAADVERSGLRTWEVGTVPREVQSGPVVGYPALVDEGDSVALRVLGTPAEQAAAHALGTRRLLQLTVPSPVRSVTGRLTNPQKLALSRNPHGSVAALLEDCTACAVDALVAQAGGPAWDAEGFAALRDAVRSDLDATVLRVLALVEKVLARWHDVGARLDRETRPALAPSVADLRAQVGELVGPGFATRHGLARLPDVARYLDAAVRRLDRLVEDPQRDLLLTRRIAEVQAEVDRVAAGRPPALVEPVRWMVQELRVSLFAPPMKTRMPVSEQRITRALDALVS